MHSREPSGRKSSRGFDLCPQPLKTRPFFYFSRKFGPQSFYRGTHVSSLFCWFAACGHVSKRLKETDDKTSQQEFGPSLRRPGRGGAGPRVHVFRLGECFLLPQETGQRDSPHPRVPSCEPASNVGASQAGPPTERENGFCRLHGATPRGSVYKVPFWLDRLT